MIRLVVSWLVGLFILAAMVRTFFAVGWLVPLTVVGGSMAPHWVGEHLAWHCPDCDTQTLLPTDYDIAQGCPTCDAEGRVAPRVEPGHRVVASRWRTPRRWDLVLFRSPHDARQLAIKRVVGLPGETVHCDAGDVWIDGKRVVKSWEEQQRLRIPAVGHWESLHGRWRQEGSAWRFDSDHEGWLRWEGPVRDDLAWNHRLARRLHQVNDRMLSAEVRLDADASCTFHLGSLSAELRSERVVLSLGNAQQETLPLPTPHGTASRRFDCSTFDGVATIALDGQVLLVKRLHNLENPRCEIEARGPKARGAGVTLRELSLGRDVYYEAPPQAWHLGPEAWFLLGDNQAISIDSRQWGGGIPTRLLLGVVPE